MAPPPLSPIPEHNDECPTTPSKHLTRTSIVIANSSGNGNSNNIGSILSNHIDTLPKSIQFILLALCVFFFFGIHNVLQEAMINTDGFHFGVMLGWMEVLGVTLFSGIERSSIPFIGNGEGRKERKAPWRAYPPLTFCLLLSSSLASWSLNYINFPTKVVFRSCKLLPTMVMAYIMGNHGRFTLIEIGSALAVCVGLITFASGDWSLSQPQFHPFGLTLVTLSVFADAVLPNAQEKLFRTYDASKSEVMFFTNIYTLGVQSISAFLSGDLIGMLHFILGKPIHKVNYFTGESEIDIDTNSTIISQQNDSITEEDVNSVGSIRHTFILYILAYIFISHVAVSAHTAVVKKFGGVAAVFVGTARKGMTLILSFVIFPKESNWRYPVGAILVLGGLLVAGLEKQKNKRNKLIRNRSDEETVDTKISVPSLPLSDSIESEDGNNNRNGQDSERQPLIDVETGRAPSNGNGPERRTWNR